MSSLCFSTWGNAGENIVYNIVTTFLPWLYYTIKPTMRKRSKLHWPNVVCHPWAIVVYSVEPTLDQCWNAIWVITDDNTAPIALLLASVVRTNGSPGCGKVRVTASERMRLVLVKADCCSVLHVRFL